MAAWVVEATSDDGTKKKHFFVCGPCAAMFYNEDRDRRAQPTEGTPPDGVKAVDCLIESRKI